jgi:hypothetical protein
VKAEAVAAAEAELDRRELERELRAVPTGGELDREVLERELLRSGPEGATVAWELVDARLSAERASLERLCHELPADPLDALSWASELCEAAAKWRAWKPSRQAKTILARSTKRASSVRLRARSISSVRCSAEHDNATATRATRHLMWYAGLGITQSIEFQRN